MESITYLNLQVSGFPFEKILSCSIRHRMNEPATAVVVGEMEAKKAKNIFERIDERTVVTLTTTAKEQEPTLFCGLVAEAELQSENAYERIKLKLISCSTLLDLQRKNRSYQTPTKTYEEILSALVKPVGDFHLMVPDRALGSLVVRYQETDWEFLKRMASLLRVPLVTNLFSKRPQIYFGLPPASKTRTIKTYAVSQSSNLLSYQRALRVSPLAMQQDFGEQKVKTHTYAYLGDAVVNKGKTKLVKEIKATLQDGILEMELSLMEAAGVQQTAQKQNLMKVPARQKEEGKPGGEDAAKSAEAEDKARQTDSVPPSLVVKEMTTEVVVEKTPVSLDVYLEVALPAQETKASGRMMRGQVQSVVGKQVQVHLPELDEEAETGGTWLFPYATAYSSKDRRGWYSMPKPGDEVLVFFPSGKEGEGFATSSLFQTDPPPDGQQVWRGSDGKEILFSDKGIEIIGKKGSVFLRLLKEDGIELASDQAITLFSEQSVNLIAEQDITIQAGESIKIGTEQSFLELNKEEAILAAGKVIIN